jgi:hypothetical protein
VKNDAIEQRGFRLLEQLDETSRTQVWRAVQTNLDRTVILQILKGHAAQNPGETAHFLMIARRIAHIKSEAVCALFDIVSEAPLHYVVMEQVDGPTLEELVLQHGPLPFPQILRIAASLADGLDQMWRSAHLVHRNLKGATIRLDERGIAKITDFSLAIEAGPGIDATDMDQGLIVGTPCFLSPEQASGSRTLTTQSDMYALGALLYYLATGHVPFEELDVVSILAAHCNGRIPPPHLLRNDLPKVFSWFLHRLMMKSPENRYAGWDAVRQDLDRLRKGTSPVSCVRPDDTAPSTVDAAPLREAVSDTPAAEQEAAGPRIRMAGRPKNEKITAYQSKTIEEDHAREIRRETLVREGFCWLVLAVWLIGLFWVRAVLEPAEGQPDVRPAPEPPPIDETQAGDKTPEAEKGKASTDVPETSDVPVPPPSSATGTATDLPAVGEMHPALKTALSQALIKGNLIRARALVQSHPDPFRNQAELAAFLTDMPDPDALVAEYLLDQTGKPLQWERNGKTRTVIPRAIVGSTAHLDANGNRIAVPLDTLSPEEKLRWMNPARTAHQTAAQCLLLLHSPRRHEIRSKMAHCPLLAPFLDEALRLMPEGVTPPAE